MCEKDNNAETGRLPTFCGPKNLQTFPLLCIFDTNYQCKLIFSHLLANFPPGPKLANVPPSKSGGLACLLLRRLARSTASISCFAVRHWCFPPLCPAGDLVATLLNEYYVLCFRWPGRARCAGALAGFSLSIVPKLWFAIVWPHCGTMET